MFDRATAAVAIYLLCAIPAHAGLQLYEGSWIVKSHGNERTGGTEESYFYSAVGFPNGAQCNPHHPRCHFDSTPTDGAGNFYPFTGRYYCVPWYNFGGMETTVRPAKGLTQTTGGKAKQRIPPVYRNPIFFTPAGAPNRTECTPTSTGATPGGKGIVQAGHPVTGTLFATHTAGNPLGGLAIEAAQPGTAGGLRVTGLVGDLLPRGGDPAGYTYTYATLRNDAGVLGPGEGPGSFAIQYIAGQNVVASINVKQGAAKFGGTMRMLGALTMKVCYPLNGGCSLATPNWLYDVIGAAANTHMGVVTQGHQALTTVMYFNSGIGQYSTVRIEGSRFPWTTGSVTVTAVGRGPHKTVHYGMGYDNRTPTSGKGTVQLVSPTMTRWLRPGLTWETGGVAILRLKFVPEPRAWAMLIAGVSALVVAYRLRH